MDFKAFTQKAKEKAVQLKDKAIENKDKAIDYSAKKLTNSKKTISSKESMEELIKASATTKFKNKETGVEKEYKHKSIAIFADEGSDFFKDMLFALPIMATKAFTQNITIKLAKSKIDGVKLSTYKVKAKSLPTMVVFQEEKFYKVIEGSENILKLVKSFNLDINKQIDEFNIKK